MTGNEINEVYNKVEELLKINLRQQINNSVLYFSKLTQTGNNVAAQKVCLLIINSKKLIFNSKVEPYEGLLGIIHKELEEINEEINYYEYHKSEDINYDEIAIDYALESLGLRTSKLEKLQQRIYKLMNK